MIIFLANKSWTVDGINKETSVLVNDIIIDFFMKIKLAENRPYTPVTSKQKIKILFVGLKHSGKSSFLLTINRKHSELTRRDSDSSEIHIADMLGTTVIKWDL
jgi:GTPase SAR1 family protein